MIEIGLLKKDAYKKSFIYLHNRKIKTATFKADATVGRVAKIAFELIDFFFEDKVDKGGNPYIEHLKFVAEGVDGNYKIIGLLHDILEDTICTPSMLIEKGIPSNLVDSIVILTHNKGESYSAYIDRIVASEDIGAILVKRVDLINNMDLSRLKNITKKDEDRVDKKYKPALKKINDYLISKSIEI